MTHDAPGNALRLSCICLALLAPLAAAPLPRSYGVEQYEVSVTPDLASKRLAGEVTIHFQSRIDRLEALELDAGDLEIASVLDAEGFPKHVIIKRDRQN